MGAIGSCSPDRMIAVRLTICLNLPKEIMIPESKLLSPWCIIQTFRARLTVSVLSRAGNHVLDSSVCKSFRNKSFHDNLKKECKFAPVGVDCCTALKSQQTAARCFC